MDEGLGFRGKGVLVDSSADKQKKRRDLPRPTPACLILIDDKDYKVVVMAMVVLEHEIVDRLPEAPPSLFIGV
jgi:hypothetical protein